MNLCIIVLDIFIFIEKCYELLNISYIIFVCGSLKIDYL